MNQKPFQDVPPQESREKWFKSHLLGREVELRELYERSNNRILELMYQDKAEGFETFAWFLMLSEKTKENLK